MVSTLRPENSGYGSGTAIIFRSNSFCSRRKWTMERASFRRSISSPIWTRKPSSSCNVEPASWSPVRRTRISINGCMRSRSVATTCSMFGRNTLTATSAPVVQAGPVHHGDRRRPDRVDARTRRRPPRSGRPRSSSTLWRTSGKGTSGPVSRQARNSSATSSPNMPGDEAMICPNFMKVPPRSSKLLRSGRANCDPGERALANGADLAQGDRGERAAPPPW